MGLGRFQHRRAISRGYGLSLLNRFPNRISVVVKLGPLEKRARLLSRNVAGVAHPKISPVVFFLPLNHPQHAGYAARTPWRETRVHIRSVVAVRDVDSPVSSNWVGIDRQSGHDGVFPLFLHLGMHDKQGVVRQVDAKLTLSIRRACQSLVRVFRYDASNSKFPCNTER